MNRRQAPAFMRPADVARLHEVSLERVTAMIADGVLEAVCFGSITFVRASDVDQLAAGGGVGV
jgi:hypothetical protein